MAITGRGRDEGLQIRPSSNLREVLSPRPWRTNTCSG